MKEELALKRLPFEGEVVSGESRDYYRSLRLPELKSEVEIMIKSVEGGLGRVNRTMQGKLITALEVLKESVPRGQWQRFLKDHRLNPSTVRNWRARGRGELITLQQILGGSFPLRQPRKEEPISESAAWHLAKAGERLAQTVLRGDWPYARKLAKDYRRAFEGAA